MENDRVGARQLRLAVVTNVWRQGKLSDDDAKEILSGPLTPGDDSSIVDDSELLGDPDGLAKIAAQHPMQPKRGERALPEESTSDASGFWKCIKCKHVNIDFFDRCVICNSPRPRSFSPDKPGPSSPAPLG